MTDPNGAVVAGAKVEAKEIATGRVYKTTTTDGGLYVLPTLPVGSYSITVEQPGFKKHVQTDIEVRVALRETINTQLELGDVQQSVQVKAEVPLLETTTAAHTHYSARRPNCASISGGRPPRPE